MNEFVSLKKDLSEWIEKTEQHVHEAVKESVQEKAHEVLATARQLVPVNTGELRDSLQIETSKAGHFAKVKADAKKAWYAFLVHFGTVKMPARPFLYQAAERNGISLPESIKNRIRAGGKE